MESGSLSPQPPLPQVNHSTSHFACAHDFTIGRQYNIAQQNSINHTHIGSLGLLGLLDPVPDASHIRNRKTSPPDSVCVDGTRTTVLRQVVSWIDGGILLKRDVGHILWLYGSVGCGKSAIAQTVAELYSKKRRLLASFFFFRGSGDRSRSLKLAATLASQLAAAIPSTAPLIEAAIRTHAGLLTSCPLALQIQLLFLDPFQDALRGLGRLAQAIFKGSFVVVLDGLDECNNREEVAAMIDHLLRFFRENPRIPLRFFILSRVEEHIRTHLSDSQVNLLNLVSHASFEDILFVTNRTFDDAAKHSRVLQAYGEWPRRADRQLLAEHAGGSFAFMSTILRYILDSSDDECTREERLSRALRLNPGLDTLYAHTLARSENLPHFYNIIWTIALLHEPLSIAQLAELLQVKAYEIVQVLVNLQSIVQVPGDDYDPVTLYHTSLRDFLTTQGRSGRFFASPNHHSFLTVHSLTVFHTSLNDIYFPSRGSAAEYAKSYWRSHWRSLLDHGMSCIPDPQPQLRRYIFVLVKHINSMWPEFCQILLPLWSLADHSLLANLSIDIHPVLELMLSLPQYKRLKIREPRWRAVTTTITSALAGVVDAVQDVLDIRHEMPSICRRIGPQLFDSFSSGHTTLISLCLSQLFPQFNGPQAQWRFSEAGNLEWGRGVSVDLFQKAATLYLFFALPQHLASAAKSDPAFTRETFLHDVVGDRGRRPFLLLVRDWGWGHHCLDKGLGLFSPSSDGKWSPAFLEKIKDDIQIATSAVRGLLQTHDQRQLPSKTDWGFVVSSGDWYKYKAYTSMKGDFSIMSMWMGYCNIVDCISSQQEGAHDDGACQVHIRFGNLNPPKRHTRRAKSFPIPPITVVPPPGTIAPARNDWDDRHSLYTRPSSPTKGMTLGERNPPGAHCNYVVGSHNMWI